MISIMLLTIILAIILSVVLVVVTAGGALFLVLFGDLIVGIFLITCIIKLFKKKK